MRLCLNSGLQISYICQVTYQTELFLDKNKDYVIAEHVALLNASKCSFVSGLFPISKEDSSKQSKFSSIGARFKVWTYLFISFLYLTRRFEVFFWCILQQQLQALLETLSSTEPHYIRCVKPNNLLKPAIFENQNVLQQLRCGVILIYVLFCWFVLHLFDIFTHLCVFIQGVMEAIRISCAGYPTKRQFYEFVDRFGILAPEVLDGRYHKCSHAFVFSPP